MPRISWKDQLINGRVFELRSKSKQYPAPCALILNAPARFSYQHRFATLVDTKGVVGDLGHTRPRNPLIYVDGLRPDEFTSKRIVRRRRDLERFDADDLAVICYGIDVDFDGRLHTYYTDRLKIPPIIPAVWTIFWTPAFREGDFPWFRGEEGPCLEQLLRGAWYTTARGGHRHLGYSFGEAWATRHTGKRLREIEQFLRARRGNLVRQESRVVRRQEGKRTFTTEIRRDCPALGCRSFHWYCDNGDNGDRVPA